MKTATVFISGLTHRGGRACVRAASDIVAFPSSHIRGETETDLGEQRVRKKQAWEERESPGTERCVCGGDDRDSDVISIRSRGRKYFHCVPQLSGQGGSGRPSTLTRPDAAD